MHMFKEDLKRYLKEDYSSTLEALFYEESLWFLFAFRLAQRVRKVPILYPLRIPTRILHRIMSLITGIQIPIETAVHEGLYLGHGGKIVINKDCIIGSWCDISTGVVIGVSGQGEKRGSPCIGARTYIGPGAKVIGKINVGSGTKIGANAVVIRDVPINSTVVAPEAYLLKK